MENKKWFNFRNPARKSTEISTVEVTKEQLEKDLAGELSEEDINSVITGISAEAMKELILSGQPINEKTVHQVQEAHRKLEEDKKKVQKGMRM